MSYFAAALARQDGKWFGDELELKAAEDLDGVIDALRSVADDADTLLLLLEQDDEWFAIVRVDEDGDPRVFLSDFRATETSELGAILGEAAVGAAVLDDDDEDDEVEDDDEEDGPRTEGDPVGDAELLADLGTPAAKLLALCAEEGQLPADILSVLCESAGCLDELESLRLA